jgi:hypothetical protein
MLEAFGVVIVSILNSQQWSWLRSHAESQGATHEDEAHPAGELESSQPKSYCFMYVLTKCIRCPNHAIDSSFGQSGDRKVSGTRGAQVTTCSPLLNTISRFAR